MGLFSDQIEMREIADDEALQKAFEAIAAAVTQGTTSTMFVDIHQQTHDAITAVLKYYRANSDAVSNAANISIDSESEKPLSSLSTQFELALRKSGIMHRQIILKNDFYKHAIAPIVGVVRETKQLVTMIPSGFAGYKYTDACGKSHRVTKEFVESLEPDAFTFYKPFPEEEMKLTDFAKFVINVLTLNDIACVGIATLFITFLGLMAPKINYILFGAVVDNKSVQLLIALAIFVLCVTLSQAISNSISTLLMAKTGAKISSSVQAATMMRILSLPASFFREYGSGEIASRASQVQGLATMIVQLFLSASLTSVFSLVYVVQVFEYAPSLTLAVFIVIALQIIISVLIVKEQNRYNVLRLDSKARQENLSFSILSGMQKVRLSGAEKRFFANWGQSYAKVASIEYNPPFLVRYGSLLSTAVVSFGTIAMYYLAVKTNISVAEYYAFNTAYGLTSGAFLSLTKTATSAAGLKAIFKTVEPIFAAKPEYDATKRLPKKLSGAIEFNGVSFRYEPNSPYIINNLSLKIKRGQYVAIVGKTGCGKSTLLRLLLGFEKPQAGALYYDGYDVATLDMRFVRKQLGLVLQDGKLMQGDILSNLQISTPDITYDQAWEALELAELAEDVRNMPMGLHTLVSEGGGGLSGGQKQRLLIARAISGNPKILIFDEATSALDNITQKKISETLSKLNCTRLVIAHRLSTIKLCDRIVVLDDGKIIEDGTYDELIAQNGLFASLVERQRLDN